MKIYTYFKAPFILYVIVAIVYKQKSNETIETIYTKKIKKKNDYDTKFWQ